jgi:hypothetical protein
MTGFDTWTMVFRGYAEAREWNPVNGGGRGDYGRGFPLCAHSGLAIQVKMAAESEVLCVNYRLQLSRERSR